MSAVISPVLESALRCHERGEYAEAERHYRAALAVEPDDVQAVHCAGVLALQTGDYPLAATRLRRALELGATLPGTYYLLARALKGQGDLDGAIAGYRRALEADRDMVDAHIGLGLALKDRGLIDDAITSYRSALSIQENSFEACLNLAGALQLQGDTEGALAEYERAAVLRPESAAAHYNLGRVLRARQRDEEALARFQRAVSLDPGFLDAYLNLGNTLATLGHYAEAVECLRHLQGLLAAGGGQPADPVARTALEDSVATALAAPLVWSARFDEAAPLLEDALAREPDSVILNEYRLVILPYRCERQQELLEIYRHYQRIAPLRRSPPQVTSRRAGGPERLRIGYLSGDLRDHSMAFFLEPLLANHDRSAFEITCYAVNREDDDVTARFRALVDAWVEARDLDDDALAARIAADGIDVLVDLSGRTVQNRLGVFAKQPAWLQVAYLGYPTYTGVPQIAYRVTDAVIDPAGDGDGLPSERPLRLPRSMFCYRPPADAPACERAGAPGEVRFGSFNQMQKLSPAVLAAWARILQSVPGSRLLLKATGFHDEAARRRMIDTFARAGIAAERVSVREGIAERRAHLALYNEIDIALDTYPYNGATTTCEALWMGVPVVTLAGETHAARMGASLLSELGLAELIAHSVEDYVAAAVRLAAAPGQLAGLHATLRQRFAASPLRDEAGFARAFEHAVRAAWQERAAI